MDSYSEGRFELILKYSTKWEFIAKDQDEDQGVENY